MANNKLNWKSFGLRKFIGSSDEVSGVYIIYQHNGCVMKVGQSTDLVERFKKHQNNKVIMAYDFHDNPLLVTWASLPESYLDGVERYLANHYQPLIAERFPDVYPISVNLPS
jgi:hypothetical protein